MNGIYKEREEQAGLAVAAELASFVRTEVLPGLALSEQDFWQVFAQLLQQFSQRNVDLLAHRDKLQEQIDDWYKSNNGRSHDAAAYRQFLVDIGYLLPELAQPPVVSTTKVDEEIASIAGPQLVVPVMNARFAINAANARWGSLYDALYGTDVISEDNGAERAGAYNPERGVRVIQYSRDHLDAAAPLVDCSHTEVDRYSIEGGKLVAQSGGVEHTLADESQCVAYRGDAADPAAILLRCNGLHIELQIDRDGAIGKTDRAGVNDVVLESALTTIQDCEDSVAAVDAEDKVTVYRNWLGLMRGDLSASFSKGGKTQERTLEADRMYTAIDGGQLVLPGRSLLFVRNVGHLMRNDAVLDANGEPVFEGLLDAMLTVTIGMYDIQGQGRYQNSRAGSIYIVKPKMHGPDEVQLAVDTFAALEQRLGLDANTIKIGIMDEERRTTLNLEQCIAVAANRLVFINTGFLDRTGDEIHTSMQCGAMLPKERIKQQLWIDAYEKQNVALGLRAETGRLCNRLLRDERSCGSSTQHRS